VERAVKQIWILIILSTLLFAPMSYIPASLENPNSTFTNADATSGRVYGELAIEDIYEAIQSSKLRDIVQKFTENGSRYLFGGFEADVEGPNKYARYYIIEQFNVLSRGRIEIEIFGDYYNVIGKLPGYLPGNNPIFAITAHYDSPEECPGANCDGGGIAVMLGLAEVMSQYEWPLDIYFMALNGLHPHGQLMMDFQEGSDEVSREFEHRGIETLALFNIDTILYPDPSNPNDAQVLMGYDGIGDYSRGRFWAELTRTVSNNYGSDFILPVPSNYIPIWYTSDHYLFYIRGFSGTLCAFESGYAIDETYHTGFDVFNNPHFNYDICREVAAAIGGSMAYIMGRTYGERREFNFSFIIQSERTERLYIPISMATNIEVSCRWFGGPATFHILNPNDEQIGIAEFDHASAWEPTTVFNISIVERGLYTLILNNSGSQTVGFEIRYSYESDIDHNGVPDSQEFWINPGLFSIDEDADGLSAAEELFLGTDDNNIDSDFDTMDDKYEIDNGFNPADPSDGVADSDGDSLSNAEEYSLGLNPWSTDSDFDMMPDNWELEHGLNPLVDDANQDLDNDGKTNLDEFLAGSDPDLPESELSVIPAFSIAIIGILSLIIAISWYAYQESRMID